MKPLDPLSQTSDPSPIEALLRQATPACVRQELRRLDTLSLSGLEAASRRYAHGAMALREGRLEDAVSALEQASTAFEQVAELEAARLSQCEAWLAKIRRGPRSAYEPAIDALRILADDADEAAVRVVATHYCGTALRYAGQSEQALQVLLEAFAASDGLLVERAQVLNSLGTLYVVLGAYGAGETVLAHAAELNHQIADRVSEAISYGQLGSAALAQGQLKTARRHLQQQEWLASQVGDAFGQSRALVLLGDLANDLGRPDDAIELADKAQRAANGVSPPLRMWIAYATRTIGRAKIQLRASDARQALQQARALFDEIGNQLGEALVRWDLAQLATLEGRDARPHFHHAATTLASLGMTGRVAQLLMDVCAAEPKSRQHARTFELAAAAAGQCFAHLANAEEVELVLSAPEAVAELAMRRIGGLRNLGRLAAHTLAPTGFHVAIVAAAAIGAGPRAVPTRRSRATLVGQLPGVAMLAWPRDVEMNFIARDLSSMRVALGEDTRAVLGWFEGVRIVAIPFAGELGAEVTGADLYPYVASAVVAAPGKLCVLPGVSWDRDSEGLAVMSGYRIERTKDSTPS